MTNLHITANISDVSLYSGVFIANLEAFDRKNAEEIANYLEKKYGNNLDVNVFPRTNSVTIRYDLPQFQLEEKTETILNNILKDENIIDAIDDYTVKGKYIVKVLSNNPTADKLLIRNSLSAVKATHSAKILNTQGNDIYIAIESTSGASALYAIETVVYYVRPNSGEKPTVESGTPGYKENKEVSHNSVTNKTQTTLSDKTKKDTSISEALLNYNSYFNSMEYYLNVAATGLTSILHQADKGSLNSVDKAKLDKAIDTTVKGVKNFLFSRGNAESQEALLAKAFINKYQSDEDYKSHFSEEEQRDIDNIIRAIETVDELNITNEAKKTEKAIYFSKILDIAKYKEPKLKGFSSISDKVWASDVFPTALSNSEQDSSDREKLQQFKLQLYTAKDKFNKAVDKEAKRILKEHPEPEDETFSELKNIIQDTNNRNPKEINKAKDKLELILGQYKDDVYYKAFNNVYNSVNGTDIFPKQSGEGSVPTEEEFNKDENSERYIDLATRHFKDNGYTTDALGNFKYEVFKDNAMSPVAFYAACKVLAPHVGETAETLYKDYYGNMTWKDALSTLSKKIESADAEILKKEDEQRKQVIEDVESVDRTTFDTETFNDNDDKNKEYLRLADLFFKESGYTLESLLEYMDASADPAAFFAACKVLSPHIHQNATDLYNFYYHDPRENKSDDELMREKRMDVNKSGKFSGLLSALLHAPTSDSTTQRTHFPPSVFNEVLALAKDAITQKDTDKHLDTYKDPRLKTIQNVAKLYFNTVGNLDSDLSRFLSVFPNDEKVKEAVDPIFKENYRSDITSYYSKIATAFFNTHGYTKESLSAFKEAYKQKEAHMAADKVFEDEYKNEPVTLNKDTGNVENNNILNHLALQIPLTRTTEQGNVENNINELKEQTDDKVVENLSNTLSKPVSGKVPYFVAFLMPKESDSKEIKEAKLKEVHRILLECQELLSNNEIQTLKNKYPGANIIDLKENIGGYINYIVSNLDALKSDKKETKNKEQETQDTTKEETPKMNKSIEGVLKLAINGLKNQKNNYYNTPIYETGKKIEIANKALLSADKLITSVNDNEMKGEFISDDYKEVLQGFYDWALKCLQELDEEDSDNSKDNIKQEEGK